MDGQAILRVSFLRVMSIPKQLWDLQQGSKVLNKANSRFWWHFSMDQSVDTFNNSLRPYGGRKGVMDIVKD
jgi:hypothetical protein